ncbi:hypothetical protein [Staphylococcus haemolyticus]|uniref:hypothetical protein n=1 Tax=Staphylococcus haemolyticus TaxID=1283 RepID=UPI0011A6498A|nr:hypothetical protein [Staphylococcus haemolyticus]
MIKIYKNKNDELECHVKYAGYDFKFQCIRDEWGATYEGSNTQEYLEFESNIDIDGEILSNLQNIMFQITRVFNWQDGWEGD